MEIGYNPLVLEAFCPTSLRRVSCHRKQSESCWNVIPNSFAKFLTGPSSALKEYGIDPETLPEKQVHALEAMVQQTQENIRTNAKLVGVEMAKSEWGIGMGCCNDVNTRFME